MNRIDQLKKQRALVAEHLAWLDREIKTLEAPSSSGYPRMQDEAALPAPVVAPEGHPDEMQFDAAVRSRVLKTRMGCVLVFVSSLLALAGVLAAVYFWRYRS